MLKVHTKPLADGPPQPFPRRGRDDEAAASVERTGGGKVVRVGPVDLPSIDGAAQHEMVPSPAVIGAKPVGRDGPAELARREHRHVVPPTLTLHLVDKGAQRGVDLVEFLLQAAAVVRVRVEPGYANEVGTALGAQL